MAAEREEARGNVEMKWDNLVTLEEIMSEYRIEE